MIIEARDISSGDAHFFDVNFAAKNGGQYVFMWLDGTRRTMEVSTHTVPPEGVEMLLATFDVPSHEIIVQSGR
jgi:hypothetical protein